MGGGDQMVGLVLFTSAFLTLLLPPCLSLPVFPAEILSGNNTGRLEFAVGSDVTIQCRVRDPTRHDITNMRLYDGKPKKDFDVIVVGDDTIQTTLYNVSLGQNNVMVCQEGAQILTRKMWCVGYRPSPEMTVSCQLYPTDRMTCSVHTDQPQDTLCNVRWSLHYLRPQSDERRPVWKPFPGAPNELFQVPRNVSWPDVKDSLFYFGNISVRATAENGIGIARASVTFVPVEYAVPGPVESLTVASSVTDPASLRLSWKHSLSVTDSVCAGMGGLSYLIQVDSPLDPGRHMMKYQADCSTNIYRNEQHFSVTGLIPNTPYTVTLTPRSPRFSGTPVSAVNTTSQSRPLKAPVIVGWSAGASPASLAVYWKPLSHRYQGGPIVAHTISVTSTRMASQREDYNFPVSADVVRRGGQLVTSRAVLKGCSAECDVTVTSSTVVGASPPASIRISSGLKDLEMPIVYTEKADSGNRTVSWEGSVNVSSVAWCYGTSFDEASSLIQCQTEVEEMVVEAAGIRQMVIPADLLKNRHPQTDTSEMCENCRWHFAVRVTNTAHDTDMADDNDTSSVVYSDYDADNKTDSGSMDSNVNTDFANDRARNETTPIFNTSLETVERVDENSVEFDPGRLVWNQCQYVLDGEAPTPEVKVAEAGRSDEVVVTVQSRCSRSPDSAGKPIQAELAYGDESLLQNCSASEHMEVKAIRLGVHGDGAVRGQLRLSDLRRGSSYIVCVRLRSRPGWGEWHQEQFFYKNLADNSGHVVVPLLVCGLALLAMFILCCLVCRICINLKEKSQRFCKLPDFTMDNGPWQHNDDSAAGPQIIYMTTSKVAVSSDMAVTSTVSPHQQSLSSKDSAFEESGRGSDVGTKSPDSSPHPQRAGQGSSDPTSTARVSGQETSDDLESDGDEDEKLLGDDVAEVRKEQLPESTRPVPGFGLDTSRPQSLQSPSSVRNNVPVSTSAPASEGCLRPEQQMENNLRNYHLCEKAQQHMDPRYRKDTKSPLRYDSKEQYLKEKPKEQRVNAETHYDFQYTKINSPLCSCACCEDPRLPSNQKCHHVYPETDSETEDSSELSRTSDGACGFTCSYTPSAGLKQTSFLQQDSDSVSYSSTEDIEPQVDCYIPLEQAVGQVTRQYS